MSRTIKFRAWDKSKKRFFQSKDEGVSWNIPTIAGINNMIPKYAIITFFDTAQNFIYSQYTGLRDKNGVEIYEGDIIRANIIEWTLITMGEIVWDNDNSCFCNKNEGGFTQLQSLNKFEVIGNIYENKELLCH